MLLNDIVNVVEDFTQMSPLNKVTELENLQIFASPLIGVAAAGDVLFDRLKQPEAIGPHHFSPQEWLQGSKSIISYFLPFTEAVRASNRLSGLPSNEWLYGRIEGQAFIVDISRRIVEFLQAAGYQAVSPATDSRFAVVDRRSNWSERHVAFIAGLGTLSLNRSLITRMGSAGRIGSIVTNLELPVTSRYYTEVEENCSHCGACIPRCPPQAIDENGKNHAVCSAYLDGILQRFTPRYGCGKCQTAVPCESELPVKASK